jgi:outer membrane protein TolC
MNARVTSLLLASTLLAAPAAARADEAAPASAAPAPRSLDEIIALTLRGPRAAMAQADTDGAEARTREADAARLPRAKLTAFATLSPEIRCENADCTRTDPDEFALRFSGGFVGASLELVQPLYTFGKIDSARRAARAGVTASRALEDAAAADLVMDATRAYWGLKLARELGYMLDDGIDEIEQAVAGLIERERDGTGEVTVQDRLRVETLLAEARVQRADARAGEGVALAGLRALTGVADVDIDLDELVATEATLPTLDELLAQADAGKADLRAARAGLAAARALADHERAQRWPDLALVGTAGITRAQGVDEPGGAFFSDPYNSRSAGLALVLRWNLEPWSTSARVGRATAAATRAHHLAELARTGAAFEARSAHAEASAAQERVAAARGGETAARAWVASVLQADAIGAAEPKDIADSYIAWFQMRARLMNATYQWNLAVVRLQRARGELKATADRLSEAR